MPTPCRYSRSSPAAPARWSSTSPTSARQLALSADAPNCAVEFSTRYWYRCLRALGLRVRGIYCTKDTLVTTALKAGVKVAWLESQTGVGYAMLKRHYGKWFHDGDDTELRRFAALDPSLFGDSIGRIAPQGARRGGKSRNTSADQAQDHARRGT